MKPRQVADRLAFLAYLPEHLEAAGLAYRARVDADTAAAMAEAARRATARAAGAVKRAEAAAVVAFGAEAVAEAQARVGAERLLLLPCERGSADSRELHRLALEAYTAGKWREALELARRAYAEN